MSLSIDLAKFAKKAGGNAGLVVRKTIIDMVSSIAKRTPVDTGRLAGNWQTTFNTPATSQLQRIGPLESIAEASAKMASWRDGSIFITNNLPYANRIEFEAWSKKAPAGMARVTVREFQQFVNKASAGVS
jgi:hypothetical protein